jgi:hypothetical protein
LKEPALQPFEIAGGFAVVAEQQSVFAVVGILDVEPAEGKQARQVEEAGLPVEPLIAERGAEIVAARAGGLELRETEARALVDTPGVEPIVDHVGHLIVVECPRTSSRSFSVSITPAAIRSVESRSSEKSPARRPSSSRS